MNTNSPTFCKMAHLGLNLDMSGMVQPCTISSYWIKDKDNNHMKLNKNRAEEAWNNEGRRQFVKNLDNGIKQKACDLCWKVEESGAQSQRMTWNKMLEHVEPSQEQPRVMVVKPGNKCNNACRSCNSHTSSAWYKDAYAMTDKKIPYKEWLKFYTSHKETYKNNTALEKTLNKWQDKIVFWDLYGGEPLIIPMTYKIINESIAKNTAKDQMLQIHTNGMVYDPNLITLASKFKSFKFGYSIDAIGSKNDYVRKLSKWQNILGNLLKYKQEMEQHDHMELTIRTCSTPFNVYYLDEFYDFFTHQTPVRIGSPTIVNDAPRTDISYLPNNVKQVVIEKLLNYEKADERYLGWINQTIKWLKFDPPEHQKYQNSFVDFNRQLDNIRKETFVEVMPDYATLFRV